MSLTIVAYSLIYLFVITLSIERMMGVFFSKRRKSLLVTIGSYVLFYLYYIVATLSGLSLLTNDSLFLLIVALIASVSGVAMYYIISLNYESSMAKRLIAAICSYLYVTISTTTIFLSIVGIDGDFAYLATLSNATFIYMIAAGFLTYIVAALLRRYRHIRKNTVSSPVFWIASVVIPIFSISIIVITGILFASIDPFPQSVAIVFVMLFLINVLTFYLQDTLSAAYEDRLKSALYGQEKEFYFSQIQLMQESVKKVRSVRHDMNFHLATLKDFSVENKVATDYINNLLGDIDEGEIYSSTGNIAFDSIINFKLKTAKEDNIKLDLSLFIPSVLNIEIADTVTILGNLLDNAIDAVAKIEDKIIRLDIEFSKSNLHIKIDNSFDGNIKYADGKGGEKKRITTLKSGDEHGHGFKNIRKSVEKYNGHIDVTHNDNIFSVGILLYVDDV